ncbi:MAG: sugar transferase, partial [Oscillospiraceae bacterium]|nr:sugar transferase [Oscillospiraceae bacterium]
MSDFDERVIAGAADDVRAAAWRTAAPPGIPPRRAYDIFKRAMDVSLSALALIILLPVLLIVSLAIKLDSKGPVFFVQER